MKKLSDLILPNRLNMLYVNPVYQKYALATVLQCPIHDIPDFALGETLFHTVHGSVVVAHFSRRGHLTNPSPTEYRDETALIDSIIQRRESKQDTVLVVSPWMGCHMRPLSRTGRLRYLADRMVVVTDDGGSYVVRNRVGEAMMRVDTE